MAASKHLIREWLNSAKWWALIATAIAVLHHPRGWGVAFLVSLVIAVSGWGLSITIGAWWISKSSLAQAKALVERLRERD